MPRLRQPKQETVDKPENNPLENGEIQQYGTEKVELFESKDDLPEQGQEKVAAKDDASEALRQQLEELKRSEKLAVERAEQASRERTEAMRLASEREAETRALRQEAAGGKLDAINAGIAAAQSEADKAQMDIESAISIGDHKGQAEAYRRLARAESDLAKLTDGKAYLEQEQKKASEQHQKQASSGDRLDNTNLPDTAKNWLRSHPDYLTDPRKNAKIQALHWDILDEGHEAFSKNYFDSMEVHLGLKAKPPKAEPDDEEDEDEVEQPSRDAKRGSVVSAPVSREGTLGNRNRPSSPRDVNLTKAQREAARMTGVTETEYAKQLIKLGKLQEDGYYGERR